MYTSLAADSPDVQNVKNIGLGILPEPVQVASNRFRNFDKKHNVLE